MWGMDWRNGGVGRGDLAPFSQRGGGRRRAPRGAPRVRGSQRSAVGRGASSVRGGGMTIDGSGRAHGRAHAGHGEEAYAGGARTGRPYQLRWGFARPWWNRSNRSAACATVTPSARGLLGAFSRIHEGDLSALPGEWRPHCARRKELGTWTGHAIVGPRTRGEAPHLRALSGLHVPEALRPMARAAPAARARPGSPSPVRRAPGYSARCSNQAKSAVTGATPASWWA